MLRDRGEPARTRPRRLWVALILLAAAAGVYVVWQHPINLKTTIAAFLPSGFRDKAQPRGANVDSIPIHATTVVRGDFPVTLNGLGTAQAWNSVTVRSRVDGQVEKLRLFGLRSPA